MFRIFIVMQAHQPTQINVFRFKIDLKKLKCIKQKTITLKQFKALSVILGFSNCLTADRSSIIHGRLRLAALITYWRRHSPESVYHKILISVKTWSLLPTYAGKKLFNVLLHTVTSCFEKSLGRKCFVACF